MQRTPVSPDSGASINDSIAMYTQGRPDLQPILKAFQGVFERRAELVREFAQNPPDLPALDAGCLTRGKPLLDGHPLTGFSEQIDRSRKIMLPALESASINSEDFSRLARAFESQDQNLATLCRAYLDKDQAAMDRIEKQAGVSSGIADLALRFVLGPVLAALSNMARDVLSDIPWKQGFCPLCGSSPCIAYLSRPETVELDALVGGGGQKWLHCSLCDTSWRFRRDACPSCGNSEPGARRIIHEDKHRHERIEACTKCRRYFLCVDLRELAIVPDPKIASLGLMHLDFIARDQGFTPLTAAREG